MSHGRRAREPVVRIWPAGHLFGIFPRRLHLSGQRGKLVATSLTDDREWLVIPDQPQRHVIGPAGPIMAWDCRHAQ
jgi:hypothetical protein